MADKKQNFVITDFPTFSRFSALQINDNDSSDEDKQVGANQKDQDSKKKMKNAKKRARKKKKAAAESATTNELRSMAFGRSAIGKQKIEIESEKMTKIELQNGEDEKPPNHALKPFDLWAEKDKQFVQDKFEEDMQEALQLSLVSYQERKGQMLVKKNKRHEFIKMPLDEFHNRPSKSVVNGDGELEIDGNINFQDQITDVQHKTEKQRQKKKKKKNAEKQILTFEEDLICSQNKDHLDNETKSINGNEAYAATIEQWKTEIERKDRENDSQRVLIGNLKTELGEVKKRNKQLCFILAHGEMHDKSELLQQLDELTNVKDELSAEVANMHSCLEQERSKVSALKLELAKYQGTRSKKQSSCEGEI